MPAFIGVCRRISSSLRITHDDQYASDSQKLLELADLTTRQQGWRREWDSNPR